MAPHLTTTHAEAERFQIQLLSPRRIQVEAAVISGSENSPRTHAPVPEQKGKQTKKPPGSGSPILLCQTPKPSHVFKAQIPSVAHLKVRAGLLCANY